jgi:NADH:ubiquinone oxidoreductase subunit E
MMNPENIVNIVNEHEKARGSLISILEEIQAQYGYLSPEALEIVARQTGKPFVDIFGIATFYRAFSLKPRGKHLVSVCLGTACHVRGGKRIAEEFSKQLDVTVGNTTPDKEFTLETVNCLGACALGPIVLVDGHYFSKVTPSRVKDIIKAAKAGFDEVDIEKDERIFPIEVRCPHCNHTLMDKFYKIDGNPSIKLISTFNGDHGWLRLSSLYGSYSVETEYEVPDRAVINIFCPHCHTELSGIANCVDCGAPVVTMTVQGGGVVQICSRRGCTHHMLDLSGVNL